MIRIEHSKYNTVSTQYNTVSNSVSKTSCWSETIKTLVSECFVYLGLSNENYCRTE